MVIANSPRLSVITVVRNGEKTIHDCVDSVLEQTVRDQIEYIVIDGLSSDGTMSILEGFSKNIDVLISEKDEGLYDAMNKGIAVASGDYIHFLNADDKYIDATVIEDLIDELSEGQITYGVMEYVEPNGRVRLLGNAFDWEQELKASTVPQPVTFVPRTAYERVGGFLIDLRIAADYEMLLRLASQFSMKWVSRPVTRMAAGGVSYTNPERAFSESRIIAIKYGRSFVGAWIDFILKMVKWNVKKMWLKIND